jgi:hypothetical protein
MKHPRLNREFALFSRGIRTEFLPLGYFQFLPLGYLLGESRKLSNGV